ncbi:glycosyltransferase family 4 protein [Photobacterium kishitanii]|uniref:glycosyltransferase family 4 protein n=1 Tax=Photobacterium kishitanii TaxID=318456 RepID=UPI000432A58F|nr:glycosyltransferase family 4 protein [Photobacterium kishitanii]CEO38472.1 hypothetical protein PPBDW_I20488 [Photobacterium kishitanii]
MKYKIIHVIPKNINSGPVNVAKDISKGLILSGIDSEIYSIRDTKINNFFYNIFVFYKYVKSQDNIILHSHAIISDVFCYILSKTLNIRWISTVHNDPEEDLKFIYPKMYKVICYFWLYILRHADKVVFLTKYICNKQNIKNKVFIHNSRFLINNNISNNLKNKIETIGFCGALIERKNIYSLVKNFSEIGKYNLLIAGDGNLQGSINKHIIENNIDNIKLLGHLDDLDVFWNEIDILILPSFAEGVPLVAIEALSRNIPLILMDLENYNGVFSSDETIFISDVNPSQLEYAINKIILNYSSYVISASKSFQEKFKFEDWILKYIRLYKDL